MNSVSCTQFEEHLEELAIGQLSEPENSRLLAHATSCASCQANLDAVSGLVDGLLQLTPRVEPPSGFESRVLERLHVGMSKPAQRWRSLIAIAACVAALGGGIALGNTLLRSDRETSNSAASAGSVTRSGAITDREGSSLGNAQLVSGAHPFVLVTIDNPAAGSGDVWCELVLANGQSVAVGSWGYDDVVGKVWAVGIDPALLAAVEMRLVADDGSVLATAVLA